MCGMESYYHCVIVSTDSYCECFSYCFGTPEEREIKEADCRITTYKEATVLEEVSFECKKQTATYQNDVVLLG